MLLRKIRPYLDIILGDPAFHKRYKWRKFLLRGNVETLDVGCGAGIWSLECLRRGNRVVAIDVDKSRLGYLRALVGKDWEGRVELRLMDVRIFQEGEKFDQILCFEVLEHTKDDMKLLTMLASMLRSHGRLLISTPTHDHPPFCGEEISSVEDGRHVRIGYSLEELQSKLKAVGLEIVASDSNGGFFTQKLLSIVMLLSKRVGGHLFVKIPIQLLLEPFTLLDPLISYPKLNNLVIAKKP